MCKPPGSRRPGRGSSLKGRAHDADNHLPRQRPGRLCLPGRSSDHRRRLAARLQGGDDQSADPEAHDLLNAKGDLDFSDSDKAVAVIVNLKDSSGLGLKFANTGNYQVFSFAKDYNGGNKLPIDGNHYQLRHLQVDRTGTVVSVCYRNTQNDDDNPHLHHRRSRYGVYLIDDRQNLYPIDPGVGNGANK
jgi:hypothetical protein